MSVNMCCLSVSMHIGHVQQLFLSFHLLKLMLLPVCVVLGILNMPKQHTALQGSHQLT